MRAGRKHRGKKYLYLLKDKDVKRWYENIARGSITTADVYLRRLGSFCREYKTSPIKIVEMEERKLYNLLMDTVSVLESKSYAGSYIQSILKVLKSWLAYNDIILKRKIKIKDERQTPTLKDERIPTKEELNNIFLSTNKSGRVASVLVAQSGIRLQVLGNYLGNDGLRIGDFPEIEIDNADIKFKKIPTLIKVRSELSKARHSYFTFLGEEGCEYLRDYLQERARDGEVLTKDSAIITPKITKKPFITTINIGDMIRKAIRKAGFCWRPYVLRSYFDTQLMLAESKGLVLRDYRTFWMGHTGDIENRYTTNKGRLPPQVIEDMRNAYRNAQTFLQTKETVGPREHELRRLFRGELLKIAGFTDEEIAKKNIDDMSDDDIKEALRRRLVGGDTANNGGGNNQRVVSMDEAERLISEGWQYVDQLANQKVVVRAPF